MNGSVQNAIVNLGRNLRAGFRLASTGRGRAADFVLSVDQIVLLTIATAGIAWIGSYIASSPPRDFYLPAIESLSFRLLLTLGFAAIATRLGSGRDVTPLAVVLLSLAVVERVIVSILDLSAIYLPIVSEPSDLWGAWYATAVSLIYWGWLLGVTFAAVRLTSSLHPIRIGWMVGTYLAALWNVLAVLPPEPFYVTDTWSQDSPDWASIDAERVMYDQRDRVEDALNSLAPERSNVSDLYFVGFAGDATQAVFRREVAWVRSLFEQSFDARDRSISLVNSDQTLDDRPLASSTNLAAVLAGVGRRMDRDRDVLFLFLTSHGSQTEDFAAEDFSENFSAKDYSAKEMAEQPTVELAVEFPPFPLRSIAPPELRQMLDEADIRWRVIVISSCFSGGFIQDLENDETLVITASAAGRESFGCSQQADFTYFGRAYFQQELARTRSFEAAFEAAKLQIEVWERVEGKEPSEPQMAMGDGIRPVLRALERQLEATRSTPH